MTESQHRAATIVLEVEDPELPHVTIGDLGMVRSVTEGPGEVVEVVLTPTYTGCPATEQIRDDVLEALASAGHRARVEFAMSPAWIRRIPCCNVVTCSSSNLFFQSNESAEVRDINTNERRLPKCRSSMNVACGQQTFNELRHAHRHDKLFSQQRSMNFGVFVVATHSSAK